MRRKKEASRACLEQERSKLPGRWELTMVAWPLQWGMDEKKLHLSLGFSLLTCVLGRVSGSRETGLGVSDVFVCLRGCSQKEGREGKGLSQDVVSGDIQPLSYDRRALEYKSHQDLSHPEARSLRLCTLILLWDTPGGGHCTSS